MASRDNELGVNPAASLPSRRSLRQSAAAPDASDAVLSELQRQVSEVKARPGAGTGELRRDRSRLRGTDSPDAQVKTGALPWVDRSPLDSVETTTTAAISLPPVVLPPVAPPPVGELPHVLAPITEQFSTVTVREVGQARGRKPATSSVRTSSAPKRRRGFAARMVTLTAMIFVGMMAIATSIPANALLSPQEVAEMAAQAQNGTAAADVDGQSVVASGTEGTVGRDSVSVTNGFQLSMRQTSLTYANNPNSLIQWPFHVTVPIADGYGYRVAPCDGCSSDHKGVDFDPGQGAPIMSVADGTVIQTVESYGGLGFYVVVAHNVNGLAFESWYGHMLPGSINVSVGQNVKLGEVLGQVGDTGMSTGAHLHLEIHVNNEPVDPFAFLVEHNR